MPRTTVPVPMPPEKCRLCLPNELLSELVDWLPMAQFVGDDTTMATSPPRFGTSQMCRAQERGLMRNVALIAYLDRARHKFEKVLKRRKMSEEFRDDLKKLMGKHAVRTDAVKMEEILEQELNLLKQGRQARKLPVEKASAVTSSSNQHHFPASQSTSSLLPWGPLLHDDYSVTSVIPPNMWWLWLNNYYGQQQQKMMTVSSGGGAASNKIGGQGPSTSGSLGLPPHDQQHQHYPCRFDARRLGIDRTAGPVETANVQPPAPPAHIQQRKRVHCPVLACTKDYADNSSSLRYHVEETHGWHVWRFAVEYKVTHGIDLIGIKDGHPYLIEQHQPTDEP